MSETLYVISSLVSIEYKGKDTDTLCICRHEEAAKELVAALNSNRGAISAYPEATAPWWTEIPRPDTKYPVMMSNKPKKLKKNDKGYENYRYKLKVYNKELKEYYVAWDEFSVASLQWNEKITQARQKLFESLVVWPSNMPLELQQSLLVRLYFLRNISNLTFEYSAQIMYDW